MTNSSAAGGLPAEPDEDIRELLALAQQEAAEDRRIAALMCEAKNRTALERRAAVTDRLAAAVVAAEARAEELTADRDSLKRLVDASEFVPRIQTLRRERDEARARVAELETENERQRRQIPWSAEANEAVNRLVTENFTVAAERDALTARAAAVEAAGPPARTEPGAVLQSRLFEECETAGWDPEKRNSFGEECAHLHEEVSEAFREWRVRKDAVIWYEPDGKPRGVPIELADVLIGLFYNAELHGFNLMAAVEIKHRWNLRRDYQAEGRTLHPLAAACSVPPTPAPKED